MKLLYFRRPNLTHHRRDIGPKIRTQLRIIDTEPSDNDKLTKLRQLLLFLDKLPLLYTLQEKIRNSVNHRQLLAIDRTAKGFLSKKGDKFVLIVSIRDIIQEVKKIKLQLVRLSLLDNNQNPPIAFVLDAVPTYLLQSIKRIVASELEKFKKMGQDIGTFLTNILARSSLG